MTRICELCGEDHTCDEIPPFYVLTEDDVGHEMIHAFRKVWRVMDVLGIVALRECDTGKRVYLIGGVVPAVLYIESEAQRDLREWARAS